MQFYVLYNTLDVCYPFGMVMPGRSFTSESYRFGFQGQEKNNDISSVEGGHLDFKYRIHDARLGRFFSVDPLVADYPWNSPYSFSENRVIDSKELEGAERIEAASSESQTLLTSYIQLMSKDDILWKTGVEPFMSCADDKYIIYLIKDDPSWGDGDGVTYSYTRNDNLVSMAYSLMEIRGKDRKKGEYSLWDYNNAQKLEERFTHLGLLPEEIIRMDRRGYKFSLVMADDMKTLAHELILHENDALDGVDNTTTAEEHIDGHGLEFYQENNVSTQYSPNDNEVAPNSKMGKIYERMDRVSDKED